MLWVGIIQKSLEEFKKLYEIVVVVYIYNGSVSTRAGPILEREGMHAIFQKNGIKRAKKMLKRATQLKI